MFAIEVLLYLLLGIGFLVWFFWEHPARRSRPSIAEEMLADHHTIKQTLDRYLGIAPPAPSPAPEVVQEVVPDTKTPEPLPQAPPPKIIVVEKQAETRLFDIRQMVIQHLIWNRKY
jgi:outer membrane biosynthesis protein TonB